MEEKVSVLIAVYNTEAYLSQCLDSLIAQKHTDWEAICVDDCSTDSSLSILNDHASRDNRFKVIHLDENQGQAKARNIGINHCTGSLVCFLDSDDWLSSRALRNCVQVFQDNPEADCVIMRCDRVWADGRTEELPLNARFPLTGELAFELSLDWSIHGIYMTRMHIQRQYPYDDTCRSFSDDNTTRLHYLASRQVHLSDGIYYYRQNPSSVSHVVNISRFNFLLANEHMQRMLEDMNVSEHLINLHEKVRWLNLIGCYRFYLQNRNIFSLNDCTYALTLMHRIWKNIDTRRLSYSLRLKPGYATLPLWTLFQWQQKLFMWIKG